MSESRFSFSLIPSPNPNREQKAKSALVAVPTDAICWQLSKSISQVFGFLTAKRPIVIGFSWAKKEPWDRKGGAMACPRRYEEINTPFPRSAEVSILTHDFGLQTPELHWYAIWTRSRQEKVASNMLRNLGIQHYLPLQSEVRQWSDRKQVVEIPVFGGYLFVHINPTLKNSQLQVLQSPGVVAFVGNQNGPLPIPNQEIDNIRTVLAAKVAYTPCSSLNKGDRVRVTRGPLAGVEGTLVTGNSTTHLLVSIEMIRQSLSVNVLRDDVVPVGTDAVRMMHFV
jgi:transcription antitermination factor NusG